MEGNKAKNGKPMVLVWIQTQQYKYLSGSTWHPIKPGLQTKLQSAWKCLKKMNLTFSGCILHSTASAPNM